MEEVVPDLEEVESLLLLSLSLSEDVSLSELLSSSELQHHPFISHTAVHTSGLKIMLHTKLKQLKLVEVHDIFTTNLPCNIINVCSIAHFIPAFLMVTMLPK